MQNSTTPSAGETPTSTAKPRGFFIIRISKSTGEKTYWHGFSKEYPGYWSKSVPWNTYWERKHAQAVMTRKGWKNNSSCYTYSIEEYF